MLSAASTSGPILLANCNFRTAKDIHVTPVVRHKGPAPASFCVSPMKAREAGYRLG
jgi:hypothetical protein